MHILAAMLALNATVVGLTEAEMQEALHGHTVTRTESFSRDGKSAGRGLGAVVIECSIAEVWATLSRPEDKAEYMPRVKSVTVLERRPAMMRVRMEVDASVLTARYTAWFRLDEPTHTLSWTLDKTAPDNTLTDVEGEYRLFEVQPTRTLVVYRAYVNSGHAVPAFIQGYMTRRSLPNLLHAVKARIESGGRYHK